ncbi:MAG: ribosome maturation factor RimP, partial [Candidatus Azotimanducaceae bacterium]
GKRKYTGLLCGVEDGDVVLRLGEEEILFPFADIDKAHVVPEFDA